MMAETKNQLSCAQSFSLRICTMLLVLSCNDSSNSDGFACQLWLLRFPLGQGKASCAWCARCPSIW